MNGNATLGEKREAFLSGALARPFFLFFVREGGGVCVVNKGSAPEYDVEKKVISLPSCVKRVTYSYLSLVAAASCGKGAFYSVEAVGFEMPVYDDYFLFVNW